MTTDDVKAGIYRQLGIPDIYYTEKDKYVAVKPARSYAYYNPAKKNSSGAIEVKGVNWMMRILLSLFGFMTILGICISTDRWIFLGILLGEIALFFLSEWLAGTTKIIVDQDRIQVAKRDYFWKDYQGAYIAFWVEGRTPTTSLILMTSATTWDAIEISGVIGPNKLGTAIRDMEPPSWKE
ncbi:hypothetical protein CLV59_105310 [Chitinophaga dinghuensis]|uniref:Uncharacterized protein n=1 Tax=Chitinophaga dinghuensis TaxID=1539050 RepID=A0A327VXI0_9BACT|nr:hypothetical protein [Chitinophaga dinghuensis]RAJ80202.1 hypothetical protein CLV59_105310 [Chitinophaga dinghuensis]